MHAIRFLTKILAEGVRASLLLGGGWAESEFQQLLPPFVLASFRFLQGRWRGGSSSREPLRHPAAAEAILAFELD